MTDRRPRRRSSNNPDFLDTRISDAYSSNVGRTNPDHAGARYNVPGVTFFFFFFGKHFILWLAMYHYLLK